MAESTPLTDTIAIAVSELVHADRPPTHDQLSRLFARAGLTDADPYDGVKPGKLKRVRAVLTFAIDEKPDAGAELVALVVRSVRAGGGFRPTSDKFVGEEAIRNVQDAFRSEGYALDSDGVLRPMLLDDLDDSEWPEALRLVVRRIRVGATDSPLVTGSGKDLLEAVARTILIQKTGGYDDRMGFPGSLFHAFDQKRLATPPGQVLESIEKGLDTDPQRRLEQTFYLLGVAVNKLRNAEGTGHGRPFLPTVTDLQARAAVEAMATISAILLDTP